MPSLLNIKPNRYYFRGKVYFAYYVEQREGLNAMVLKIVTDSTTDLPTALYKEFDIAIVPEYLRWGPVYRDHIDFITA
jgi:hypothetical protein